MKNIYHQLLTTAGIAVAMLAGLVMPAQAQTQWGSANMFVLTNGDVKWELKNTTTVVNIGVADGGWYDSIPKTLYPDILSYHDTTIRRVAGTRYLALDPAAHTDGTADGLTSTAAWTPRCVWQRSSENSGYYYQEIDGYRYWLLADANGLKVQKVQTGYPLPETTLWYDWDFGAAIMESYRCNGRMCNNYYWIMYNGSAWVLSCNSYERPETIIYDTVTNSTSYRYYCNNGNEPAGIGAVCSPIDSVYHPREIVAGTMTAGRGFVSLALGQYAGSELSAENRLPYLGAVTATATVNTEGASAQIRDAYIEYRLETRRIGMNLNYRNRTGEGIGLSGIASYQTLYATADNSATLDAAPTATGSTLAFGSIAFRLNNRAKRYLTLSSEGTSVENAEGSYPVTVTCANVPPKDVVDTLFATVTYTNGVTEERQVLLYVSGSVSSNIGDPEHAPVIAGAVFGGGRMASVGANTAVTVHRCDTVPSVYGGNDISGRVQGAGGSTVTLGTASTTSDTAVRIGSVYGGGNGYYNYQYETGGADFTEGVAMTTATQFKGSVLPWGVTDTSGSTAAVIVNNIVSAYIPTIRKTHVVVAEADVYVDSLFGGAKNAYITGDDGSSVVIDQQDGVVYAEFGGNNYGGTLGGDAKTVTINVSGTRVTGGSYAATTDTNIVNTYFHGYGRDLGVRYLFGGGNKVEAPAVTINMTGGMVDTLFAGGNSASVKSTSCTVNCADGNSVFVNNTTGNRKQWVGGYGRYNVRCLFGGNNLADMSILPTLTLTSGGIGTVYGGGNQGAMTYSTAVSGALATELEGSFTGTYHIKPPTAVSTHVAVGSDNMKIDYLYGGCRMADVSASTYVNVSGGEIGTLFGGSNIGGRIGSTAAEEDDGTYVVLSGGTVWVDAFAGSNGYYHCNNGTRYVYGINFADNHGNLFDPYDDYMGLDIPTHERTHLLMTGGSVHGNVYGGANLTHVGNETTRAGEAHLTLAGGVVENNVYGGGNMAYVNGLAYLTAMGNTVVENALYAGNDKVGRIRSYTKYRMYDGSATLVTDGDALASDGTQLNKEEGGVWSSNFSTYVRLEGTPAIKYVYGSGNGAYNYGVPDRPQFGDVLVYCAGEDILPLQSTTFIDIHTSGLNATNAALASTQFAGLDTVFGGGNGVGVESNVLVLLNAADAAGQYVNTVFGGNNRDDMTTCVPDIVLRQGQVGDVYGGGNQGGMSGLTKKTDVCGNEVDGVSTYVFVDETHQAKVNGVIYGGCNMADVTGMAYVDIRGTDANIDTIYGGNNVSGHIAGNTRVDISAGAVGTVYGGSNGYYDYHIIGEEYKVYPFGTSVSDTAGRCITIGTMPDVDSTNVNILGGTVANVYGGGRMGDCRSTCVVVDDQTCGNRSATITGNLFGGGEGIWSDLNRVRRGNVGLQTSLGGDKLGASYVHLRHAYELTGAKAYGGGRGGDVYNTYITAYSTWEQPFDEIYGGCWGSDVYGTAHLTMNGNESGKTALNVYGGNDLTGNVYKCDIAINGGTYDYIYGAGNGNYTGEYSYSSASTESDYYGIDLEVPNAEYVNLTFNRGTVNGNLYGGGKMGTTMSYRKDARGQYENGELKGELYRKVADTALTRAAAYSNPEKYSYILVNVHGGAFKGNIYAGGAGSSKQIVYGLKELNMDQSVAPVLVDESIYGGSENVHDGYGSASGETQDKTSVGDGDSTTLRPSSILNVAGGIIDNNVYGGGYLGNVYGSVYVNIGVDAIENSTVWTNSYNGSEHAYLKFKPGYDNGYVDGLTASNLALEASVYGGANWGDNVGNYMFSARGFYGGESRILIDGNGYKTDDININTNPGMTVNHSIIGSGTSAAGGDVLNHVMLMNYGTLGGDCHATRELWSIQRADSLWLWNTSIHYLGATDAVSAYPSQDYTINRIGIVNARGYNIMEIDALMTNISELSFYTDQPVAGSTLPYGLAYTDNTTLYDNSTVGNCEDNVSMCTKIGNIINSDSKKYTALVVNNGVNVDIIDEHGDYGALYGYAYLVAEPGTNAIVAARAKTEYTGTVSRTDGSAATEADKHVDDGGFLDGCQSNNQCHTYTGANNGWETDWESGTGSREYEFNNYYANYRVWSIGSGKRSRYTVILAHANPSKLQEHDWPVWLPEATLGTAPNTATIASSKLGLAHATLDLPASKPGNYYILSGQGIVLRDDNSEMDLTDYTWNPGDTNQLKYKTLTGADRFWTEVETTGSYEVSGTVSSSLTPFDNIIQYPGTTFGLLMASGANFQKVTGSNTDYVDPLDDASTWNNGATVISGNPHVNIQSSFRSASVGGSIANSNPELDFYLTYDTSFSNTLMGEVSFQLIEYQPNPSDPLHPIEVGTVDVVVSINTIIDIFTDQDYELLAMYNEGRTNTFTRKAVLPATLENRDLYLTSVKWLPTVVYPSGDTDPAHLSDGQTFDATLTGGLNDHFNLTDDPDAVINTKNVFSISIDPSDNVSSTLTTNEGWHDIYEHDLNLYGLAVTPHSGSSLAAGSVAPVYKLTSGQPDTVDLRERDGDGGTPTSRGLHIGQLDGRGLAALNVTLNFDGLQIYKRYNDKGYVGRVDLTFQSFSADQPRGSFTISLYVKTRDHGDTIYIASAETLPQVTYSGGGATQHTYGPYSSHSDRTSYADLWSNPKTSRIGKRPEYYIQSFTDAFDKTIYEEGDVIAIIGQVDITPGTQQVIQGSDYYAVPVIRYEGHHHEYPGEKCVYRGTMINVTGGTSNGTAEGTKLTTSFATRSIVFDGSSMGKLKHVKVVNGAWEHDTNYYPDTNAAYGPVIAVSNGSGNVTGFATTVSLENNSSVSNNLNVNAWDGAGVANLNRGAISVVNGGELTLMNNVTVEDNITVNPYVAVTDDDDRPYDGAVYVDRGVVSLAESHKETAVTIAKNYLLTATADNHVDTFWKPVTKKDETNTDSLMRYGFDTTAAAVTSAPLANVFLTRLPSTDPDNKLDDAQSDSIVFTKTIPQGTRIGVTKWFPGITSRDTIGIAVNPQGSESYLTKAITFGNFFSDGWYRGGTKLGMYDTLYNFYIDNNNIFLHRCATFRQQVAGAAVSTLDALSSLTGQDALQYHPLHEASCPTGGDTLLFHVQGGFMPYSYTWTQEGETFSATHTTTSGNLTAVNAAIEGNTSLVELAIVDTCYSPYISMLNTDRDTTVGFSVVATDVTGCRTKKSATVTLLKSEDAALAGTINKTQTSKADGSALATAPDTYWTDGDSTHTALGTRYFNAIKITPMVWVKGVDASITAWTQDHTHIYVESDPSDLHDFDNLYFCEGEVLNLSTSPVITSGGVTSDFIMWDFDPYYSRQAQYVVPSHSDTVVAYYGPRSYWRQVVNSIEKGGGYYDGHYYYDATTVSAHPTVTSYALEDGSGTSTTAAGYVTTYLGDVHIYNENGLAWFLSVVNGLNGTQSRSFFFNKVYLHEKEDGTEYDMKAHLWTPVGTAQHRFRGSFIGTSSTLTDTVPASTPVIIKNIVVNEPYVDHCGFFGFLDEATIKSVELASAMVRGAQYVGSMAASVVNSRIKDVNVTRLVDDANTMVVTHYSSGGMVGKADHSYIDNSMTNVKYVGDAVYTGGMVGTAVSTSVSNSTVRDVNHMASVYSGGVAGSLDSESSTVDEGPFTVTAYSESADSGEVYIVVNDTTYPGSPDGLSFPAGTQVTITAYPTSDYYTFDHWSDGSTSNPYVIQSLSENITLVASFTDEQITQYTVSVLIDPDTGSGTVEGAGSYRATPNGAVATLTAYPNDGYEFSYWGWSDDSGQQTSQQNPLTLTLTDDITVMAYFTRSVNPSGNKRGSKDATDHRNYIQNNYVQVVTNGHSQRVGGLVGYAKNATIENNYVYGRLDGLATEAGVGAIIDQGTQASHNYYEHSVANRGIGQTRSGATASRNIAFSGQGSQVTLMNSDYGVTNLTRVLNIWVRGHEGNFKSWRSDLEGRNNGYPIFGTPDMIPVHDSLVVSGCDSVEWDGVVYLADGEVVSHVIDSVMMVDSTFRLRVVVNHSSHEQYSDSVDVGQPYSGHGFELTETEVALLQVGARLTGNTTIILSDTLQGENGCDSIITLLLTINRTEGIVEVPVESQIRVYPNPAVSRVTIESSEAMSHVELYDNEGRRLRDYQTPDRDHVTLDVSTYATGAYYLRIHTAGNITIQKLIKK